MEVISKKKKKKKNTTETIRYIFLGMVCKAQSRIGIDDFRTIDNRKKKEKKKLKMLRMMAGSSNLKMNISLHKQEFKWTWKFQMK